jgi:Ni,Fe-hydrogenase III component G
MDIVETLRGLPGAAEVDRRTDGLWMTAPALDVAALAAVMLPLSGRLSTMTAIALESGETTIIYHYCVGTVAVNIKAETRNHAQPSLAALTPSAAWIEREIHDLYAVEFVRHPRLTRLVRPPSLPDGFIRTEAGSPTRAGQ